MKQIKIAGVVALYKPQKSDIKNIEKYIEKLDICYLMDDTGETNIEIFIDFISKHPNVKYFCNETNIGLCKSVNIGLKKSYEYGADWVLIMNPDGTFQNDAIRIFKKYIKQYSCEDISILAPQYNYDRHPRKSKKGYRFIKYPDMTGCLYNMKIMNILGYYDENIYFYNLDVEYDIRVRKEKYKIVECSEAILNHHPAETHELKIFNKVLYRYGFDPPDRFYYQFGSMYYIYKKYGLFLSLRTILFHFYKLLKVFFFFENKMDYLKMIKKGIRDARVQYYGKYR